MVLHNLFRGRFNLQFGQFSHQCNHCASLCLAGSHRVDQPENGQIWFQFRYGFETRQYDKSNTFPLLVRLKQRPRWNRGDGAGGEGGGGHRAGQVGRRRKSGHTRQLHRLLARCGQLLHLELLRRQGDLLQLSVGHHHNCHLGLLLLGLGVDDLLACVRLD